MRAALALLAAAVVVLAACGGGETVEATPETTEGTVTTATTTAATTTNASTTPGQEEGDATAGKEVFATAGCGSCHTLSDAGTNGQIGPNLDDAKPDYELVVERVTNGMGQMPAFKDQLTEKQIQDVAAYVSSVAGS